MKFGDPLPRRRQLIQRLQDQPSVKTNPVDFQGQLQYLPVHTVSIDFPKYRLENGRTGVDQIEYLAGHPELPKDLFEKSESDIAQQHQHNILKGMINEADLHSYFKKNKQIEPLILDTNGFVVNGNRRLCALRELYYSEEERSKNKKYAHFKNLQVVFLPPCDQKDILALENLLQIQNDIKAGYRWYNTAFMFKKRLADGMPFLELQKLYELSKKEINNYIAMYEEAEKYLRTNQIPGQFSKIPESKYAFDQLVKSLGSIDEAKKDAFVELAYLVIEKAEGRRAYDQIPKIASGLDDILRALSSGTKSSVVKPKLKAAAARKAVSLLGGVGELSAVPLPRLKTEAERNHARLIIVNTIGEVDSKRRQQQKGDFVRSQLDKAATCIKEAIDDIQSAANKKALPPLVARLEKLVVTLKAAVR